MNEMNGKYTIEVLKESDLALLVGGSKASYQRGSNYRSIVTRCIYWNPIF